MSNSKFHGMWESRSGERIKTDGEYPSHQVGTWYPVYNERRIQGIKYTPYSGASAWVKAANRDMANRTRLNFEKKSHH